MTEEDERATSSEPTVESVVEAVLFAGDEPLREARLADIVGTSVSQIRKHVKNLNDKYKANGTPLE